MLGPVIWLVSAIWSMLSAINRLAADLGIFHRSRLDARVISVGNIQVGGAGKTPLVAKIAQEAMERGLRVAILSRGYRGQWERVGGVIAPVGNAEPDQCGDEAALLHELAPHAWIGVGADRVQQFKAIQARAGTPIDLVILDDGFQHQKLTKDLEVVALTAAPRTQTLYRDWRWSLRRADLLVWTKGDERPVSTREIVKIKFQLPQASGSPIWLVTGLAGVSTEEMLTQVKAAGYDVKKHLKFSDHARYSAELVQDIIGDAAVMGCRVAISGKDAVKWKTVCVPDQIKDVIILEPELMFEEGRDLWNRVLWGA